MTGNRACDAWETDYPRVVKVVESLVTQYTRLQNIDHQINNTREDLLQEAQIAAFKAIKTYDAKKKASLSTYVYQCVANRFRDLRKSASRHAIYVPLKEESDEDIQEDAICFGDFESIDHEWFMEQILSPGDHDVYLKIFVFGYTPHEVARIHCRITGVRFTECLEGVRVCFRRICQSYESNGKSHPILIQSPQRKKSKEETQSWLSGLSLRAGSNRRRLKSVQARS